MVVLALLSQMRALLKIASNEFEMRRPAIRIKLNRIMMVRSTWPENFRDFVPTVDHHSSRSSVKGHKSSIKEGNALQLGTSQLKQGRFFF